MLKCNQQMHGGRRPRAGRKTLKPEHRRSVNYSTRISERVLARLHQVKRLQVKGYRTQALHQETDAEVLARCVKTALTALKTDPTLSKKASTKVAGIGESFTLRFTVEMARQIEHQIKPGESYYKLLRRLVDVGLDQLES